MQAFYGLLPRVDQPRGLRLAPGALVLGRLLRPARPQGRRRARRRGRRRRARRRPSPPCATRSAPTCTPRSRTRWPTTASTTFPASVELGDFDPTLDGDRPGARRRAGESAAARAHAHLRSVLQQFEQRRESKGDWQAYTPYEVRNVERLHPPRAARARPRASRLPARGAEAGRLERVGGGGVAPFGGAALHRRHAAHLGRHRASSAPSRSHVRLRAGVRSSPGAGRRACRWSGCRTDRACA